MRPAGGEAKLFDARQAHELPRRQVAGFRAPDKEACRREDDLFCAAMYAVLVSLGDGTEGLRKHAGATLTL